MSYKSRRSKKLYVKNNNDSKIDQKTGLKITGDIRKIEMNLKENKIHLLKNYRANAYIIQGIPMGKSPMNFILVLLKIESAATEFPFST